jgi:hypothetical protein
LATVVTHRDGLAAKVDNLDQVRMAGLFTMVEVVASMDRVDGAGGHRILGSVVHGVEHRLSLPDVVVSSSIEPLSVALDHRANGPSPDDERRSNNWGDRWTHVAFRAPTGDRLAAL